MIMAEKPVLTAEAEQEPNEAEYITLPSGLANASGTLLNGTNNEHAGTYYGTSITFRNLAGQASKLPTLRLFQAGSPGPTFRHTMPQ